jgi:hypothetical protein
MLGEVTQPGVFTRCHCVQMLGTCAIWEAMLYASLCASSVGDVTPYASFCMSVVVSAFIESTYCVCVVVHACPDESKCRSPGVFVSC